MEWQLSGGETGAGLRGALAASADGTAVVVDDLTCRPVRTGYRNGGILADGATMATVAELLSLPPARALLGMMTYHPRASPAATRWSSTSRSPRRGRALPLRPPSLQVRRSRRLFENNGDCAWCLAREHSKSFVIESAQLPAEN